MAAASIQRAEPRRGWSVLAAGLAAAGLLCSLAMAEEARCADNAVAEPKPVEETEQAPAPDAAASERSGAEQKAVPAWMRIPVIQAPARSVGADPAALPSEATPPGEETPPGGAGVRSVPLSSTAQVQADGSLRLTCGFGGEEHSHASTEEAHTAHASAGGREAAAVQQETRIEDGAEASTETPPG